MALSDGTELTWAQEPRATTIVEVTTTGPESPHLADRIARGQQTSRAGPREQGLFEFPKIVAK